MYLHGAKDFLYPDDESCRKLPSTSPFAQSRNPQFPIRIRAIRNRAIAQSEPPYPLMHPSGLSFATIFEIPALWHTVTTSCTFL